MESSFIPRTQSRTLSINGCCFNDSISREWSRSPLLSNSESTYYYQPSLAGQTLPGAKVKKHVLAAFLLYHGCLTESADSSKQTDKDGWFQTGSAVVRTYVEGGTVIWRLPTGYRFRESPLLNTFLTFGTSVL